MLKCSTHEGVWTIKRYATTQLRLLLTTMTLSYNGVRKLENLIIRLLFRNDTPKFQLAPQGGYSTKLVFELPCLIVGALELSTGTSRRIILSRGFRNYHAQPPKLLSDTMALLVRTHEILRNMFNDRTSCFLYLYLILYGFDSMKHNSQRLNRRNRG